MLGQPTPFDNQVHAFIGDSSNGQPPITIIMPPDFLHAANVVQVPTVAKLQQLLQDDPDAQSVGPFAAGDDDTEPVHVRKCVWIPNRYALLIFGDGVSPRVAWERIYPVVLAEAHDTECQDLIDWLRVAITRRAAGGSQVAMPPLQMETFTSLAHNQAFQAYRVDVMRRDLPETLPGSHAASTTQVVDAIGALADEQRKTREEAEARRQTDANKTPRDLFGSKTETLMRLCQIARESDLPEYYRKLANTKRGERRHCLEAALEQAAELLGYYDLVFPVSPALAQKVNECHWYSHTPSNFAVGVNIFALGPMDPVALERRRADNIRADSLDGGTAAPSYADVTTLLDNSGDVRIPESFAKLRFVLEKAHVLWYVLLGETHPLVEQHRLFRITLLQREQEIESTQMARPEHQNIVPALLARRVQIDTNYWLGRQTRSRTDVCVPEFVEVFDRIARETDWASNIPARYLLSTSAPALTAQPPAGAGAPAAPSSTAGRPRPGTGEGQAAGDDSRPDEMVRNTEFHDAFTTFREKGLRTRVLKQSLQDRNIAIPKNSSNTFMCLSWHVKGTCNARCNSREDHRVHSAAEHATLVDWCQKNYSMEA
jgi:hypothetical protein